MNENAYECRKWFSKRDEKRICMNVALVLLTAEAFCILVKVLPRIRSFVQGKQFLPKIPFFFLVKDVMYRCNSVSLPLNVKLYTSSRERL